MCLPEILSVTHMIVSRMSLGSALAPTLADARSPKFRIGLFATHKEQEVTQ